MSHRGSTGSEQGYFPVTPKDFKMSIAPKYAVMLAVLSFAMTAAVPISAVELAAERLTWDHLSDPQRKILAPLENEWNQLPGHERQHLLGTAQWYPKLTRRQQQRYSSRLLEWSKLSLEQRNLVRKRYHELETLPPTQRLALERWWQQREAAKEVQREQQQSESR
jgi:hypothetical protein